MRVRVDALSTLLLALATVAVGVLSVVGRTQSGTDPWQIALPSAGALVFLAVGALSRALRPDNLVGLLMMFVALASCLEGLGTIGQPLALTVGLPLSGVVTPTLIWLALAFPSGQLGSTRIRALVGAAYAVNIGPLFGHALASRRRDDAGRDLNLLAVTDSPELRQLFARLGDITSGLLIAIVLVILVRRWLAASPASRRVLVRGYGVGIVCGVCGVLIAAAQLADWPTAHRVLLTVYDVSMLVLPIGVLLAVLRTSLVRPALSEVVALSTRSTVADLEASLRATLGDPALRVVSGATPLAEPGQGVIPLVHDNRQLGTLVHDPALRESPADLEAAVTATTLALLAIDREQATGGRLDDIQRTAVRLVEASDATHRQIERNLHDGAQQQLVTVAIHLHLLERELLEQEAALAADRRSTGMGTRVGAIASALDEALVELRTLARGLHPALLSERGLLPALQMAADRCPLSVEVDLGGPREAEMGAALPIAGQASLYYAATEALTNVVRHAGASRAWLSLRAQDRELRITVQDDGAGATSASWGSGLTGIRDRARAFGGNLTVAQTPGGGASITVTVVVP